MAFCLWMTGLPCSGKTTIVRKLTENIPNLAILDGDELREWLSPKNFSKEARDEHMQIDADGGGTLSFFEFETFVRFDLKATLRREPAACMPGYLQQRESD